MGIQNKKSTSAAKCRRSAFALCRTKCWKLSPLFRFRRYRCLRQLPAYGAVPAGLRHRHPNRRCRHHLHSSRMQRQRPLWFPRRPPQSLLRRQFLPETDIVIFVLVCAAASAFRQVVTVAGLVQSLVVCFFQCKYSCSRGCSCGCDHCSNDGSFHVDTSFLRHLVSVVIWKFCGSAAENTDVVYILIIPCFQRKYKPRHPEFWRLCGKNFQSGEDQTCSSACFRSAVISPMFSRPTEMRIRPPSIPAAFSCSSVSWR